MVNFSFLILELILADQINWQIYITPYSIVSLPLVKSHVQFFISNIRANIGRSTGRSIPLQVESCCGEKWQFYISTFSA